MSKEKLVLVFDAGTQSTRAFLFNKKGEIVCKAKTKNFLAFSRQPGFQEKDALMYWEEIGRVSRDLKIKAGELWKDIEAVSVTMLRNCFLCLDKDMKPLRPVITWMDQRLARFDNPYNPIQRALFGIAGMRDVTKSQYETSYANWLRQNEKDVWDKTYKYVAISAYINYLMTGNLRDSKASTLGRIPYDYKKREWMGSKDLTFNIFGVSLDKTYEIVEPTSDMGHITKECSLFTGIPEGLPVIATGSDKACECLGCGCIGDDIASLSFGTAANIQMTVEKYMNPEGLMPSYTSAAPNMYNPEIQTFRGFWMITWFKEQFCEKECAYANEKDLCVEKVLDEMLDKVPVGSNGLFLQPYWGPGLMTPRAKGAIIGFSDTHKKEHVYRAILEGLNYALYDSLKKIERHGHYHVKKIMASGGGSSSDKVCQLTADVFGLPVSRPHTYEASGLGSAMVTFLAMGEFKDIKDAMKHMVRVKDTFTPNEKNHEMYMTLYHKIYTKMYGKLKKLYVDIYDLV